MIKKEIAAFTAEGYMDGWIDKDAVPVVTITINNGRESAYCDFSVEEAEQMIEEIKAAIEEAKTSEPLPF